MQKSPYPLKMQPLAVTSRSRSLDPSGRQPQTLSVHIPAGIDEGKTVRLAGKGQPGINGGKNGDLMLAVHVLDSKAFRREGMDVYSTIRVPFVTAALGDLPESTPCTAMSSVDQRGHPVRQQASV